MIQALSLGLVVLLGCACSPGTVAQDSAGLSLDELSGLSWAWGDLHAHSAWSYDGCERPDEGCAASGDGPGSGFFSEAAEAGLDFAALTDHAEADLYRFGPDEAHPDGAEYDIWQGQQYLAVTADGGPVLPLLGYEWTAARDAVNQNGPGTHRSVILGATQACDAYRISGKALADGEFVPEVGDRAFLQGDRPVVRTPAELWLALGRAATDAGCEPVRWATFAHHPAYITPQATDWSLPENAPLGEHVVEIYSEHGSSECWDSSLEGCGWALNEAQGYHPQGSIQAALDHGYQLGFVAGTDGHDGRPGSIADGPSHVAHWSDGPEGEPQVQFTGGGLTGLLAPLPLTRDGVLDALDAARTVGTSGPRPDLSVWATGQDGTTYLPGSVIPRWNLPAGIVLVVGDLDPSGTLTWDDVDDVVTERVTNGGQVVASGSGEAFGDRWDPTAEESWTYLRVRLLRAVDPAVDDPLQGEERVWVSPWFVDPDPGCSAAPARSPGRLLGLLAVVLWSRRRRFGSDEPAQRPLTASPSQHPPHSIPLTASPSQHEAPHRNG